MTEYRILAGFLHKDFNLAIASSKSVFIYFIFYKLHSFDLMSSIVGVYVHLDSSWRNAQI